MTEGRITRVEAMLQSGRTSDGAESTAFLAFLKACYDQLQ